MYHFLPTVTDYLHFQPGTLFVRTGIPHAMEEHLIGFIWIEIILSFTSKILTKYFISYLVHICMYHISQRWQTTYIYSLLNYREICILDE